MAGTAAALDAADLLLLLPSLPATITCTPGLTADGVMRRWGIRVVRDDAPSSTLVADGDGAAVAIGRRAVAALPHRYPSTTVWEVWNAAAGATALVPAQRRDLVADMHARFGKPRRRSSIAAIVRRRGVRRTVVGVGHRDERAIVAGSEYARAASSYVMVFTDPRRRAAVVDPEQGSVVKVARAMDQGERAWRECVVRERLERAGVRHVPPILAASTDGEPTWLVESLSTGHSLEEQLRTDGAIRAGVVDDIATWLIDLAVRTRSAVNDGAFALRGEHASLASLAEGLVSLPGVVGHGDLAMGSNVLVDGRDFTVLDWETARDGALPLIDLLPLLCLAIARAEVGPDAEAQATVTLQMCRGDHTRSDWLFGHVDRYLRALSIDATYAGALARLSWGAVASMRYAHAELVTAAGQRPVDWVSPAEHVARQWMTEPRLGAGWESFTSWTVAR